MTPVLDSLETLRYSGRQAGLYEIYGLNDGASILCMVVHNWFAHDPLRVDGAGRDS